MITTFFGLPLVGAAELIGYVEIFLTLLILLFCVCVCVSLKRVQQRLEEDPTLRHTAWKPIAFLMFVTIIVFNFFKLIAASLLIYGASSGQASLIAPWLAANAFCLLILFLSVIMSVVAIASGDILSICNFLIFHIFILLRIYCFVAMTALYQQLN